MRADVNDLRSKFRTLLEKMPARPGRAAGPVSRRAFLQFGAVAGAGASLSGTTLPQQGQQPDASRGGDKAEAPDEFNEATIAQLQAARAGHGGQRPAPRALSVRVAYVGHRFSGASRRG